MKRFVLLLVAGLVLLWVVVGAVIAYHYLDGKNTAEVTQRTTVTDDGNRISNTTEATISSVIEKVSPSVVSIVTEVERSGDSIFQSQSGAGAGSGVIVGANGYVLTNKHVVDGVREVQVILADGTTYSDVKVVATDPLNDVAYLKIPNAGNLPTAQLGDSTTIRVGQQVIAIGNSLGQYQNTVTSGIISGTGRPVTASDGRSAGSVETLTDLLQTDAAINPGNSGGPLLNTSGQVIGINTAIAQDAEGIGFAIPVNAAKGILKQVLAGKDAGRAYLGVRYIPVNAQVAKEYSLDVKLGGYVRAERGGAAVVKNSPADNAGVKEGDVITKINDVEVGKSGSVSSLVAEYAPGDTIQLTINRDGSTKVIKVTLGTYSD